MNKKNQMKPLARLIATSLAVGSMAGFGTQVLAATAAGTLIKNLATVTYEDEFGNEYSAQSNEAVVTVAPVYFATLENDNQLSAAPGQTAYFPHTLSNTGNIADTYTVGADAGDVYLDSNNNGQPDSGETLVASAGGTGQIIVNAGEQANLVVALPVPITAADGSFVTSRLTVDSDNDGEVSDVGDNDDNATDGGASDTDTTSATNLDTANVTTGAILVLNKSSTHDEANNKITYTLTVKNTGGTDINNVQISDFLPAVDTDGDPATDSEQVTLDAGSISSSGLVNTGDDTPTTTTLVADADDIDGDGDTVETLDAIVATDGVLPANTTVTVTYTVSYTGTWAAGAGVDNTFTATGVDANTGVALVPVSSNTTHDVIPKIYDVDATDTELDAGPGVNDGGDDTLTPDVDDTQYVDVAATGGEVRFKHIIENTGNGDDVFNLDIVSTDFPANTVFTFWDSTGVVQITDTDNDGVPDTGTLAQGESMTIMVKAKLPAGASGPSADGDGYDATLTVTSSGDSSVSDTTLLKLGTITEASVDLANLVADQGLTGFNDNGVENAQNESPVKLVEGNAGDVIVFDLTLANESGGADSFLLSAGNIPDGWDVKFKKDGQEITTTTLMPGNDVFNYTAEVTISADPSKALHDNPIGVDGYDSTNDDTSLSLMPGIIDAGIDGDGDYEIEFTATSSSTSVTDTVTNVIDVLPASEVTITPNGQNQIQPGGTVDYQHKLENNGNKDESVSLSVTDTGAADGWTTVIKADTTGDGIPDTILAPSMTIKGVDSEGNIVDIAVDGSGVMIIPPGVDVPLSAVVNAPASASAGAVNTSDIVVTDASGSASPFPDAAISDVTNVSGSQVRLDKQSAIDVDCDGDPVGSSFSANQSMEVKPGECVVWRLTATNESSATVQNVVISDAAPDYTTLVAGSLKLCLGNGAACDAVPLANVVSDADDLSIDGGSADLMSKIVTFQPWESGAVTDLEAGEKVTAEFTVKVD